MDATNSVEDFGEQSYYRSITVTPAIGGWTVGSYDKNPSYKRFTKDEAYDANIHTQYTHRTRIFTDAAKLVEFIASKV